MAIDTTGRVVGQQESGGSLWRNAAFLRLWGAESVSLFGSQITNLALPLAAALLLDASPKQMGALLAAENLPFLLCSLPAGVWIDRTRRRPILIAADLGRAVLLASITALATFGHLHIWHLYAVAFGVGILTVLFEVAHYAYVPSLLRREELVEANSRLQFSHSVAESGGPGAAGIIVQALTAPVAIALDALTYVVSALLLRAIAVPEPRPAPPTERGIARSIGEGLRALLGHQLLRPIVISSMAAGVCLNAITAVYILLATRQLGIGPGLVGLIFAAGGLGAIPGAILSGPASRRCGVGATIIGCWMIEGLALLVVPLAAWWNAGPGTVVVLALAKALGGAMETIANVNQWSLRQIVTPDHLQGRVTAAHRFLVYGSFPLGALLGGLLGATLGLVPTILLGALGLILSRLWLIWSPLGGLRQQPVRGVQS
jgi:MFS family permease